MHIPHVAVAVTTTAADTVRLTYHCAACGVDSPAIVTAVAYGYSEAAFGIGQDRAREESHDGAIAALPAAITRTVGAAGCPHCGAREPAAARTMKRRALTAAARSAFGIVCAFVVLAGAVGIAQAPLIGLAMLAIGLAPIAVLTAARYRKLVREAATLVTWIGEPSPLDDASALLAPAR